MKRLLIDVQPKYAQSALAFKAVSMPQGFPEMGRVTMSGDASRYLCVHL